MLRTVEGKWEDLITREDLTGHTVRVMVLDEVPEDPWLAKLHAFVTQPRPKVNHFIDVSRESMYSGTIDDPR